MATYTVQAPDGKTVTLQGPDGASQSDILAQAQALYKPAAAPKASGTSLQIYNNARNSIASKFTDPVARQAALTRFDSDPRVQNVRKLAGLAPLSTANGEVRAAAKKSLNQRLTDAGTDLGNRSTGFQSASAGISHIGLFGLPEMLAAAGERYLPSALTGNNTDASYSNILQLIRAKDTAAMAAHPAAAAAGAIGGSLVGGRAAGRVINSVAGRAAASASPLIAKVGRVVENLGTLRKGQKVANAVKIAATGAAGGGAQAAGTGEDVVTGATEGAIAAPLIVGGFKAAQVLTRPFRDVLRLSSAGQILSRLTTATRDQLEAKAVSYRAATGAEPTLFELLPLADRNKVLKQAVVGRDNVVEATSDAIRKRAQNLGPEMSQRAQQILQPQRTFIQRGIQHDIAAARGGKLAPGDEEMIANAMDSPTDMLHLRDQEAKAIMAPHEDTPVAPSLESIFPQTPGPSGTAMSTDPEVQNVIRNAAGLIRQRSAGAEVTAGDVTDMISKLRPMLGAGGNDAMVAERAINHLHDVLDSEAPEAGAAARQMADAYAARSRLAEGMQEGSTTRLRNDVQVGTSRKQARTVRNAYDTAEGATGRSLGQGNRVLSDLGGSPEEALRATVKQSRGSVGRQLGQNVGTAEAEKIITAARAQDESAQALSSASAKAQSGSGDAADAETLVQSIAGLHPSSFITTKASAVRRLLDMTYIPETRARTIVDMLFSQNPALQSRALKAIGNEPNGAKAIKTLAGMTGQFTEEANAGDDSPPADQSNMVPVVPQEAPAEPEALEQPAPEQQPAEDAAASPYAPALQQVYQNENPDLIDLVQRVKHQESRGNQGAVSRAGAIGIMQVMPDTGPEAAQLAGVQWDPEAFHNDAAYNELLGIAYLSELLRKYDGDVSRALAAYNAGPGRVDHAASNHGEQWLAAMPAETQDYVARVG